MATHRKGLIGAPPTYWEKEMVDQTYWDGWLKDTFSEAGAKEVKKRIEDYWADRGHKVQVFIEKKGFVPTLRGAHWVVRSNLVDGLPRSSPAQIERAA